MALSSVSVKDLALFWRKDWQKKLLTKKPGISHFLLNLADFVKHTLKEHFMTSFTICPLPKTFGRITFFFLIQ